MTLIRLALIVIETAVMGTLGILSCLLVPGGTLFTRVARLWARMVLGTCRVRVRVTYHPSLDAARPAIYMSNHQSLFDIPALALAMPTDFRMVPKRELLFIPIFGQALWLAGFIFVNRKDRAGAIRSLDRAALRVERGASIVIFPEGTRSKDGQLLPFKKGGFVLALKAGVPIVPVSLRGSRDVLPRGSLRIRPGTIEAVFGAPIATSAYSLDTKERLIEQVRRAMGEGLLPGAAGRASPAGAPSGWAG